VQFAFIKASQGYRDKNDAYMDPRFLENWENSLIGILRGAYHFFSPFIDPVVQAKFFSKTIGGRAYNGELPPVGDFEWRGLSGPLLADKIHRFLITVYAETRRMPLVYTTKSYWDENVYYLDKKGRRMRPEWAVWYDLWDANYRSTNNPVFPICWKDAGWKFWQFSSKGRFIGIRKDFDLNVFYGPYEKLLAYAVDDSSSPTPVRKRVRVVYRSVFVRNGPGTSFKPVGGLVKGNEREVYEEGQDQQKNPWVRISSADEWICLKHNNVLLATFL
jgi:lysozyme